MFTGLIQEIGVISEVAHQDGSVCLSLRSPSLSASARTGDSIAVNGVCLTAVDICGDTLSFDVVPETLARSSLDAAEVGSRVNLEPALRAGDRLGGHFVQGHVDGVGRIESIRNDANARVIVVTVPPDLMRYMAVKGSVAIDGISLTLADVDLDRITVWIVPHTWENTNLSDRKAGDYVNLEVDLIARHVERLLGTREQMSGLTEEKLTAAGFMD